MEGWGEIFGDSDDIAVAMMKSDTMLVLMKKP